ncbi:MAG TPA: JDVT-CTERM domain-containing protein [Polyangia bacterium]|nr:JDVT-CTERM domain-containing protein [Polyangia bacterium]
MNGRAMTIRWSIRWSILAALGCVLAAGSARAATSCVNDVDCPNPACGGEVCDYIADPVLTCKPAGTQPKGSDGWCTTDADCKCRSLGATCVSSFCTFTKPSDAPSGGGGHSGTAGSTGAAGSSATGTGGAPATGTGGSAAAGHTGSTDGGSSGGCSVAGSSAPATWFALSVLGGLVVAVRRRRRAR